jgi:hypothetical protein
MSLNLNKKWNAVVDKLKTSLFKYRLLCQAAFFIAVAATGDAQTLPNSQPVSSPKPLVLEPSLFKHFVDAFNQTDTELYPSFISDDIIFAGGLIASTLSKRRRAS